MDTVDHSCFHQEIKPKELGSHKRKPKRTFLLRVVLRWLFIIKAPTFADKLEEDIDES